jgi:predicted metal-dependent peptidase
MMTKATTSEFDLNEHLWRLLINEPFFAALSRQIPKRKSFSVPTAAVAVDPFDGKIVLIYNPDFMGSLSDTYAAGVLKHEFYHIIYDHLTSRLPDDYNQKVWNYATDLAINSNLKGELPQGCLYPQQTGTPWEFLDWGGTSEYYYEKLKTSLPKGGGPCKGEGDNDGSKRGDHSKWGEGDENAQKMAKERMKGIFDKAAKEAAASANGWGSCSSEVQRRVLDSLKTEIDWRKVLSWFIKASQKCDKYSTVRRINRRYPYIHPGKRSRRQANIAVPIDQSGSVDDAMLALFFSELNKLASIAKFTVIPFDDRVFEDKVYVWEKGERRARERVLCGGTNFDAPTDYVNKHKFDACIIMTDMYAAKPKPSRCPRMWVTTESCASNPYFVTNERIIAVKQ